MRELRTHYSREPLNKGQVYELRVSGHWERGKFTPPHTVRAAFLHYEHFVYSHAVFSASVTCTGMEIRILTSHVSLVLKMRVRRYKTLEGAARAYGRQNKIEGRPGGWLYYTGATRPLMQGWGSLAHDLQRRGLIVGHPDEGYDLLTAPAPREERTHAAVR